LAKPFDVTLKSLLEDAPEDWPILAGVPNPKVTVIDSDIATISGAADKVLHLEGPPPWIMHFEFQSGPDASLPARSNLYSAAMEIRHDLPVQTVVVLLSPRAHLGSITGTHEVKLHHVAEPYRIFRYQLIRVWELPVDSLLHGGLGQMALAPISDVREAELPGVIGAMKQRAAKVRDRARRGRWWTAVNILMGLRYDKILVDQLLEGVMEMEESVTYQAIVAKGMAEGLAKGEAEGLAKGEAEGLAKGMAKGEAKGARQELRKVLLRLGAEQFGEPAPDWAAAALAQMDDLEQLEALATKVLHAASWKELLPPPRKTPRRKKAGP
jgi:predicted transposase YdaD